MDPKKVSLLVRCNWISRVRKRRRNGVPKARTGRRKAGRKDIHRVPSSVIPPPGMKAALPLSSTSSFIRSDGMRYTGRVQSTSGRDQSIPSNSSQVAARKTPTRTCVKARSLDASFTSIPPVERSTVSWSREARQGGHSAAARGGFQRIANVIDLMQSSRLTSCSPLVQLKIARM